MKKNDSTPPPTHTHTPRANTAKIGNGLAQLIRVSKSIWLNWVKDSYNIYIAASNLIKLLYLRDN